MKSSERIMNNRLHIIRQLHIRQLWRSIRIDVVYYDYDCCSVNMIQHKHINKKNHVIFFHFFSEKTQKRNAPFCEQPRKPKPPDSRKTAGTMLFIATMIAVLTWIPFWMDIFSVTDSLVFRYSFLLGHVTNPVVYGIVNTRFREEVKRIFTCH